LKVWGSVQSMDPCRASSPTILRHFNGPTAELSSAKPAYFTLSFAVYLLSSCISGCAERYENRKY